MIRCVFAHGMVNSSKLHLTFSVAVNYDDMHVRVCAQVAPVEKREEEHVHRNNHHALAGLSSVIDRIATALGSDTRVQHITRAGVRWHVLDPNHFNIGITNGNGCQPGVAN